MLKTAVEVAHAAGVVLMQDFGARNSTATVKGDISNVVTEADLASERLILSRLRSAFPTHGVIAEEAGYLAGSSAYTWVVDPLDGTSNYARLWDIAAPMLIVCEAGGQYTSALGTPLELDLSPDAPSRVYAVLAGAPQLHQQVARIVCHELGAAV